MRRILSQINNLNMKAFYSRPINLYGTKEDQRNIDLIKSLGYEVIDTESEEIQVKYLKNGMDVFFDLIKKSDALFFKCALNMQITQGVYKQIVFANENEIPVFEIPTILNSRVMSLEDTRTYLKLTGKR